jgi:hypothetical protein
MKMLNKWDMLKRKEVCHPIMRLTLLLFAMLCICPRFSAVLLRATNRDLVLTHELCVFLLMSVYQ